MKLRGVKIATFKNTTANIATLQTAVNDFTAGKAVTAGNSGTVAYSAGDVAERELVGDPQYFHDGTNAWVVLFYKEA